MAAHDGRIQAVKDQHGYHIGYVGVCLCSWTCGELRESYGTAAIDLWQHIRETKGDT